MTVDLEDRIRGALQEVADRVEYADDGVVELATVRTRRPVRALVAAGLAAAAVAAFALLIGSSAFRHSSSPAATDVPPSSSSLPNSSPTTLYAPSDPATVAALALWSSFPVDPQPRPIVLVGESIIEPAGGFTNPDIRIADAEKEAFEAGAFSSPSSFPSAPATAGGFPIIGPIEAFARLHSAGTGTASTTLETTDVRLGTASFLTDRGPRTLPAWLFSFRDVENPAAVLATAASAMFATPNGSEPPPQISAKATGSLTIELGFTGPKDDTGPCGALYTAHVSEAANAVAVSVIAMSTSPSTTTPVSSGGVVTGCTLEGYARHVTILLREPLGDRVLVDAKTDSAIVVDGAS